MLVVEQDGLILRRQLQSLPCATASAMLICRSNPLAPLPSGAKSPRTLRLSWRVLTLFALLLHLSPRILPCVNAAGPPLLGGRGAG